MPEENKTPPDTAKPAEPVKPYVFDTAAFEAKIISFQKAMQAVAGKANFNPFLFAKENGFNEIVKQYKLGTKSKELFESLMSLPDTIPCVDPNWVEPTPYKPILPKALQPPTRQQ